MKPSEKTERPPVVTIMGHIDHGKSTLLDSIRKTNVVDKEAGGITQHLSAYEVIHRGKDGVDHRITFLDTPGHEAFGAIRIRGARVADVGVLVVSAEDGVKPQTLEALKVLRSDKVPFVIAINKIDRPGADVERTKQNLAENDMYVEGFGGDIPWAAISAKTGEGVPELLDLILLSAEILELTGDTSMPAEGIIIESNMDARKGITATAIIKDGTLRRGEFAICGKSISPLRIVEDFLGKPIETAVFSSPVRIIGWDIPPAVGERFVCVADKKEALALVSKFVEASSSQTSKTETESEKYVIPLILKADTSGSLDALVYEIAKLENERIIPKIVLSGLGPISENDIRTAQTSGNALVIGFHTKSDTKAESLALRSGIAVHTFDIIYKLTEWLVGALEERTPRVETEETTGTAKILKFFSKNKDKQVIGGRVESGEIVSGEQIKIIRRDTEIGRGRIRELQMQKDKVGRVEEGKEFGTMIESKIEIAPGDKIECFALVQK
jgi:translation initiation factor IF-2